MQSLDLRTHISGKSLGVIIKKKERKKEHAWALAIPVRSQPHPDNTRRLDKSASNGEITVRCGAGTVTLTGRHAADAVPAPGSTSLMPSRRTLLSEGGDGALDSSRVGVALWAVSCACPVLLLLHYFIAAAVGIGLAGSVVILWHGRTAERDPETVIAGYCTNQGADLLWVSGSAW